MREVINDVLDWGHETGILSLGTKEKQAQKVVEEAKELQAAIDTGNINDIRTELGDAQITLILQAQMCGLSLKECIEAALYKNKNRPEGKMQDGEYIREK